MLPSRLLWPCGSRRSFLRRSDAAFDERIAVESCLGTLQLFRKLLHRPLRISLNEDQGLDPALHFLG